MTQVTQKKQFQVLPIGDEPMTFWLLVQMLNHLPTGDLWELLTLLYCCWKLYNDDVDVAGAYAGSGAAIRSINESLTALHFRSTFNFWNGKLTFSSVKPVFI